MADGRIASQARLYLFVLPLIAFLVAFILIPILAALANSLYSDVSFLDRRFAWFDNYAGILRDAAFWQSLRFTVLFVLVSVPIELIVGLVFALLLNQTIPLRGMMRAIVLLPWAIPAAISARTWELIYSYNYGLANYALLWLGVIDTPINWLGTSAGAFLALVLADTWKTAPFAAIIILAGLQAIPDELSRQSRIDGANFVQGFLRITLPILRPVLLVALLFRTIDAIRVFDIIYVLTNGGPGGSTASLSMYGYRYFVTGDFGYGSAVSVILFIVSLAFSFLYLRLGRFQQELR